MLLRKERRIFSYARYQIQTISSNGCISKHPVEVQTKQLNVLSIVLTISKENFKLQYLHGEKKENEYY